MEYRNLGRSGLQGTEDSFRFVPFKQLTAGEMVVIHAGLADGDNFGMAGKSGKFLEEIHRTFVENVARVQSYHGKDVVVFLGDGQRPAAAFAVDAHRDDAVHTDVAGAGDDGIELPVELGKIEVRVGVG